MRKVMNSIVIRGKLSSWISECAESHYSKSGGTASKLRDEGNFKFRCHEYEGGLKLYSESVICAPEFGPELSLAYGNRSACLYHLGHFKDCLQDIELAFRFRFPKNLAYKLHQRRGQCQTKLGLIKEAQQSFTDAIAALEFVPKLSSEKKDSLTRDMNALARESETVNNGLKSVLANLDNGNVGTGETGDSVTPPADPDRGCHSDLIGASSVLQLKNSIAKGRHITTNDDVSVGEVLFSELPYSSVLLPEHYSTHCHHCFKAYMAPIPCLKCTQPRYCSEDCRHQSWEIYHQYECTGLDLLHSVGIAHLAVRTLLVCGLRQLLTYRTEIQAKAKSANDNEIQVGRKAGVPGQGRGAGSYADVHNLLTHSSHIHQEDLFQYAVTAALLTTFLERRTTFFESANEDLSLEGLKIGGSVPPPHPGLIRRSSSSSTEVDEDLLLFVGGLMLRHITQLICNASAIYEVGPTPDIDTDPADTPVSPSSVVSNNQYRVATAIYPSASMMNHSCDPSVINSFYGSRLIVRAVKSIGAGGEVFNCYGPHFRHHSVQDRQETLRGQYHFTCACPCCTKLEYHDFSERFSALKCSHCGGPIRNPTSENPLELQMPCLDCGRQQDYSSQIEQVFLAYDLFKKGMESLKFGNMTDALPALQSCYQLRMKAMYNHHLEVTEVADQLARCYAMMGSFSESAQYLKVCLPAIQERYGMHSVEVAHELVKYTDVLLGDLQDTTKRISQYEEKVLESRTCMHRAADIFALHYGKWHNTYQEIMQKLEKTKFLVETSG